MLWPSTEPCTTAVVFVHGFWGCSEKTWVQFQTLPDRLQDQWWRECDLYFYSYDSVGTQIWPNASLLGRFLGQLFPEPDWRKLGAALAGPIRKYRRAVLVAHSEGAVITRAALLERAKSHLGGPQSSLRRRLDRDRLLHSELCLFAPAMFGPLISGWKGVLLRSPVLGDLIESCLNSSAAYKQLKEGPILEEIRSETTQWANEYPSLCAFRARSLFGMRDSIASVGSLAKDFPCEYDPEKDHVSICKPSTMYLRPVTFVSDRKYAVAA